MPIAVPPTIKPWVAPPETKGDVKWANLRTIDLSKVDSPDPAVQKEVFEEFRTAIKEDGFLYLVNFGLTQDQVGATAGDVAGDFR